MKKVVASEILRIVGPEEAKIPSTHRKVRDTTIDIVRSLPLRPKGTSTDGEARQALRYLVWQQDIGGYYYGPYWADSEARSWQNWLYVRDTAYCRYTDDFRAGDIPDMADENDIR